MRNYEQLYQVWHAYVRRKAPGASFIGNPRRAAEWEDDLVEIFDTSRPIYCLCHHGVRSQRVSCGRVSHLSG